eukprot:5670253-Prymnesium_polylepis.1
MVEFGAGSTTIFIAGSAYASVRRLYKHQGISATDGQGKRRVRNVREGATRSLFWVEATQYARV